MASTREWCTWCVASESRTVAGGHGAHSHGGTHRGSCPASASGSHGDRRRSGTNSTGRSGSRRAGWHAGQQRDRHSFNASCPPACSCPGPSRTSLALPFLHTISFAVVRPELGAPLDHTTLGGTVVGGGGVHVERDKPRFLPQLLGAPVGVVQDMLPLFGCGAHPPREGRRCHHSAGYGVAGTGTAGYSCFCGASRASRKVGRTDPGAPKYDRGTCASQASRTPCSRHGPGLGGPRSRRVARARPIEALARSSSFSTASPF